MVRREGWGRERGDNERKKEDVWSLIRNKSQMTFAINLSMLVFQIFLQLCYFTNFFIMLKKNSFFPLFVFHVKILFTIHNFNDVQDVYLLIKIFIN